MTNESVALPTKELIALSEFRQNGRAQFVTISKKTGIPVSTLYDKILKKRDIGKVIKFTCLVDFEKIGFASRIIILIGVSKNDREKLQHYLEKSVNMNSLFKVSNEYDFFIDIAFRNMREVDSFIKDIHEKFDICALVVVNVLENVQTEAFMNTEEKVMQLTTKTLEPEPKKITIKMDKGKVRSVENLPIGYEYEIMN